MNLAVLFSGGKDSTMALYWALNNGYKVNYLVTALPSNPDSFLFHTSNINLTELSAEAIGIPLKKIQVKSMDDKGEALELEATLKELNIQTIFCGGVSSNYQSRIFSKIAENINADLIAPYWNKPHEQLIKEAIEAGFDIRIVSVSAEGLTEEWLGRKLDLKALEELKNLNQTYGVDIGGEGGEYCTFVVNGPIFRKKIEFMETEKKWSNMAGELIVRKAELSD